MMTSLVTDSKDTEVNEYAEICHYYIWTDTPLW